MSRPGDGGRPARPAPRRAAGLAARPRILSIYIVREFLFSFLVSFLFFFVVFFVNQLLLMAEDILSKRAPLLDVVMLLVFAVPSEIAMAFPFASLVGALMAAGRLSSDNEILVMQASGFPSRRIFLPFAILGVLFTLVSFGINDYFLPLGSIQYGKLYRSLIVSSPAVELRPWSSRRYKDVTIVTGNVSSNVVDDLLIFDKAENGKDRVISAKTATLRNSASGSVILSLQNVWIQTLSREEDDRVEYSSCGSMEYRIDLNATGSSSAVIGPFEMSSYDLGRTIREKERAFSTKLADRSRETAATRERLAAAYDGAVAGGLAWQNARQRLSPLVERMAELARSRPSDRSIQIYKLEYYKKFSIPAGAVCFVFLAFPLGLKARRSGRSVGFGFGLLVAVLYWALLLGGQTLGTRLGISPFWAMWGANIFVLVAAALLWLRDRLLG
jgi:lipopolysaccharide export system permease protein